VAYVDPGGAFRVGPRSAGADPGPACYDRGGTEPTVTDAAIVLGRLRPDSLLGGALEIRRERAEEAIEQLAAQLGLPPLDAAAGVLTLLSHNMAGAIRSRTVEKGQDPRQFTLVAFGGAGPQHAAEVARSLGIPEVLVPPHPGITSAVGLLSTDLKYDLIRNEFMLDSAADLRRLNADFADLDGEACEQLRRDGIDDADVTITHWADCRYVGQGYELRVRMPEGRLTPASWGKLREQFHRQHRDEYGHHFPDTPIELVNVRVVATGRMPKMPALPPPLGGSPEEALVEQAPVHFTIEGRLQAVPTRVYHRPGLAVGSQLTGPAILLQDDTTVIVPPGACADVLPSGDLRVTV
jgi:N-methylhydantoinase A